VLTAQKQGACHGARGDNCSAIPVSSNRTLSSIERSACTNTPALNLRTDQPVLMCTRQDIPPRMALLGGGGNSPVSTAMRLKALSVVMVVDRDGQGTVGELASIPQCFAPGAPRIGPCTVSEACLDVNYKFDQIFVPPTDPACNGLPGFRSELKETQLLSRQAGIVCSGSGNAADDAMVVGGTSTNPLVTEVLPGKAQVASPPICMKGLDLGGFVTCSTPTLVTLETDGDPSFKEYMGVTCNIVATP
jgi:hypothetical protein